MVKIVQLEVGLTGSKEITINGRDRSHVHSNEVPVEEKIISKEVSLDQQWFVLCEVLKIYKKLRFVYEKSCERAGELPHDERR